MPPCELPDTAIDFALMATDNDPGAVGFALYTVLECERRLVVELEGITSADGVLIVINGEFVEDLPVIEGTARLELDTSEEQWVPVITEATVIDVFAAGTELLILTSEGTDEDPPCELDDLAIDFGLTGTEHDPEAHGFALYTVNDCERRLVIEIEGITSTDGVLFIIDGKFVEDLPVIEGTARLELNTLEEQEVPVITELSVIEVLAAGTEALILTSEETGGIAFAIDVHLIGTDADPDAEGIAVYTLEGGVERLVVEMAHIATANAVDIFVDGVFAGFAAVTEGFARLERDTSEGHTVPVVREDSLIEVKRNDSDIVILSSHLVFVDFTVGNPYASGGENDPLDSLGTAVDLVQETGVILLSPGTSPESLTIDKEVTLKRDGGSGTVTIGAQSRSSESALRGGFISKPVASSSKE